MSFSSSLAGAAAMAAPLAAQALPAASAALARLLPAASAACGAACKPVAPPCSAGGARGYALAAVAPAPAGERDPAAVHRARAAALLPRRAPAEAIEEVHGHIHSTESMRCGGAAAARV
jgi:hypothetical protein